jgi:hypothetical protein
MRSKFSRRFAREETVDVETAVRMLINRLQETGKASGLDPNQISRSQLSGLMERMVSTEHKSTPPIRTGGPSAPEPSQGLEITLTTQSSREKREPIILTPNLLNRSLVPYLNAIVSVQNIFNEVKGLPLRKIPILEIRSQPVLTVRLEGASEAIYVIKSIVNSWRRQNSESLYRLTTGNLLNHVEKTTLSRSKVEMASQMLDLVKAGMTEKEKFNYLSSLIPSIDILIFSEYEMS